MSKWLEDHTWITWFLRDTKGHLRPLRDDVVRKSRPDIHEEDRWKGYAGSQAWEPVIEDLSSKVVEMKIKKPVEASQPMPSGSNPRRPASIIRSASVASINGQLGPTTPRQVRFDMDDSPRYESLLKDREGSRIVKYRVGNGGYYRLEPLLKLDRGDGHDQGRQSSRLIQALVDHAVRVGGVGSIIPENPFGTIENKKPFVSRPVRKEADTRSEVTLLQYLPLLQFCTLLIKFYVSESDPTHPSSNRLSVYDIADDYGDWCGSVTVPKTWIKHHQNRRLDFIAISEAKSFTREECPVWTFYVPKEREESQWDLFYVLLLERDEEHCWWERVALGKVFKAAFETAVWDEIQLG
ncbi:hypothetical protein VM1G_11837 [Cytospora mali]|uniref:Uncharacterized protein n=1 Tax=Cytospora mali TaxID=578113 RepID=A0A194W728_CYTMA|nr:hypothetical protein VM1G_11837 [Valsa mali]